MYQSTQYLTEMRKHMIGLLIVCSFGAVALLAVLRHMKPERLKVSAAMWNARLTLEADSGDASKASPPREVLESWARAIADAEGGVDRLLYAESLGERPAVGIPASGNPDVGS
jgi:hypothetical protein